MSARWVAESRAAGPYTQPSTRTRIQSPVRPNTCACAPGLSRAMLSPSGDAYTSSGDAAVISPGSAGAGVAAGCCELGAAGPVPAAGWPLSSTEPFQIHPRRLT